MRWVIALTALRSKLAMFGALNCAQCAVGIWFLVLGYGKARIMAMHCHYATITALLTNLETLTFE